MLFVWRKDEIKYVICIEEMKNQDEDWGCIYNVFSSCARRI